MATDKTQQLVDVLRDALRSAIVETARQQAVAEAWEQAAIDARASIFVAVAVLDDRLFDVAPDDEAVSVVIAPVVALPR